MIALTQEKREEKIKRLNKIVSWADSYGADHNVMIPALEAKEIAEAYIASLTAETLYQEKRFFESRREFIEYWADVNKSTYGYIHENQRRFLFTAPPVPEIKDHQIREMVTEITNTAKKYQGCQCLRDAISKVVIKRLNGLGE